MAIENKDEGKPISRNVQHKIERWTILCYQNCVRLHEDSIILYRNRRYPSAYALSVIAIEEMGKYQMLAFGLLYEYFLSESSAGLILGDVYDHRVKQQRFINEVTDAAKLFLRDYKRLDSTALAELEQIHKTYGYASDRSQKFFPSLARLRKFTEAVEASKQDSLYVGLPKRRGKADLSARIHSPFRVTRKRAETQITRLSDYLVLEAVGVLKGVLGLDFEDLESGMTPSYIKYLRKLWRKMAPAHRKRYNAWMRLRDFDDE